MQIHITHKNFLRFQKFGEEFVLCNWKSTNFFTLLHLVLYFSPVNRHFYGGKSLETYNFQKIVRHY